MNRQALLEAAFSEIPSMIGSRELRPLSAGSFTLLSRLGNPMIAGKPKEGNDTANIFEAVIQYIWIHCAPIKTVLAVTDPSQIPEDELKEIAFDLPMATAMQFISSYQQTAMRMAATLVEVDTEEDELPGKSQPLSPVGSPPSFSSAEHAGTPEESETFSGSPPSSDPSVISMLPTLLPEPATAGKSS